MYQGVPCRLSRLQLVASPLHVHYYRKQAIITGILSEGGGGGVAVSCVSRTSHPPSAAISKKGDEFSMTITSETSETDDQVKYQR